MTIKKEFVRNPYNYDADKLSTETGLKCEDESRTEQQHIEEADINYIADRFMRTGELKQVLQMPTSGDFAETYDFQTAMNLIVEAKQKFMELPAKIRTRFQNDPAKLMEFLEDEDNRAEAEKLNLIEKRATIASPTTKEQTDGPETETSTQRPPKATTGSGGTEKHASKDAGTQKS